MTTSKSDHPTRTDLRNLDGHESVAGVCRLLNVESPVDETEIHPDTYFAMIRTDRPDRYRRKHALEGVS